MRRRATDAAPRYPLPPPAEKATLPRQSHTYEFKSRATQDTSFAPSHSSDVGAPGFITKALAPRNEQAGFRLLSEQTTPNISIQVIPWTIPSRQPVPPIPRTPQLDVTLRTCNVVQETGLGGGAVAPKQRSTWYIVTLARANRVTRGF